MKRRAIKAVLALSALSLAAPSAMATSLRFDGFANFTAGQVLDKKELSGTDFRGYDSELGFRNHSLFALQARADLNEGLSATAQIIAKGSEDFKAKFNWAFLSYQINDQWTAKFGRIRMPYFMYSDFLDVGYAYHWISPPFAVYDLSGFDSLDGTSLEWQTNFGNWVSTLTGVIGRGQTTLASTTVNISDSKLDSHRSWLLAWNLNYDWFTFRLIHQGSKVTATSGDFETLTTALQQLGVSETNLNNMLINNDNGAFDGVGISIDTGSYFVVSEYTEVRTENSFAQDPAKAWYVSGGARFGDWTYYATAESRKADARTNYENKVLANLDSTSNAINNIMSGLITQFGDPLPAAQQYTYNQLASALSAIPTLKTGVQSIFESTHIDRDTYSVGVRYNFHPSAAAKLEYMVQDDHVNNTKPAAIAFAIDLVY